MCAFVCIIWCKQYPQYVLIYTHKCVHMHILKCVSNIVVAKLLKCPLEKSIEGFVEFNS